MGDPLICRRFSVRSIGGGLVSFEETPKRDEVTLTIQNNGVVEVARLSVIAFEALCAIRYSIDVSESCDGERF